MIDIALHQTPAPLRPVPCSFCLVSRSSAWGAIRPKKQGHAPPYAQHVPGEFGLRFTTNGSAIARIRPSRCPDMTNWESHPSCSALLSMAFLVTPSGHTMCFTPRAKWDRSKWGTRGQILDCRVGRRRRQIRLRGGPRSRHTSRRAARSRERAAHCRAECGNRSRGRALPTRKAFEQPSPKTGAQDDQRRPSSSERSEPAPSTGCRPASPAKGQRQGVIARGLGGRGAAQEIRKIRMAFN